MSNGAATVKNTFVVPLKVEYIIQQLHFYVYTKNELKARTSTQILIVALFKMAKGGNNPNVL